MKKEYWLGALVLIGFISWRVYHYQEAKSQLPDREFLIGEALDQKVNAFVEKIDKKCREDAIEEARDIADSIAFYRAEALMLFDTLTRPEKPTRPLKPERLPLKDSLEVKPLIDSL